MVDFDVTCWVIEVRDVGDVMEGIAWESDDRWKQLLRHTFSYVLDGISCVE
jgi:hypothetical protein